MSPTQVAIYSKYDAAVRSPLVVAEIKGIIQDMVKHVEVRGCRAA